MLDALDAGAEPMETFYDGYVVNAIMDAAYASIASGGWEAVALDLWRGIEGAKTATGCQDYDEDQFLIKEEVMPDGSTKVILKEKVGGKVVERRG